MVELGINVTEAALLSTADLTKAFTGLRAFGFRRVRFEVPWKLVQPQKTQWNWKPVINVVNEAVRNGITLLPVLGVHPPSWGWFGNVKPTADDFGVFCREAAKVLHAEEYEIWNEENIHAFWTKGDAVTFVPHLQRAYTAVKQVSPSSTVLLGGLAAAITYTGVAWTPWPVWFTNRSPVDFLSAAYKAGAKGFFDELAYHPYALGPDFSTQQPPTENHPMLANTAALIKVMSNNADLKPVQHTEWGYSFAGAVTPTVAAKWFTTQLDILNRQPGVKRTYLYSWHDWGGAKMGILDANGNPRQPYADTVKAALV